MGNRREGMPWGRTAQVRHIRIGVARVRCGSRESRFSTRPNMFACAVYILSDWSHETCECKDVRDSRAPIKR